MGALKTNWIFSAIIFISNFSIVAEKYKVTECANAAWLFKNGCPEQFHFGFICRSVFVRSETVSFLDLEEKMKVKLFFCAVMLMFVVTGCAGVQTGGGDSGPSKGMTKEDYKRMGVDENKGYY